MTQDGISLVRQFQSFMFFPPSVCPRWDRWGVVAYVLNAGVRSGCSTGFFVVNSRARVPLRDVLHFDCTRSREVGVPVCSLPKVSSKVSFLPARPAWFLSYVHFVWQAWDIRDILKSKTSEWMCNTAREIKAATQPLTSQSLPPERLSGWVAAAATMLEFFDTYVT